MTARQWVFALDFFLLVDILRYAGEEMGCEFRIELLPWPRALKSAEMGKGGVAGFSITPERLLLFDYSEAMYHEDILIVVARGREFTFEKHEDLKGKVIGIHRGASYGMEFDKSLKEGLFLIHR